MMNLEKFNHEIEAVKLGIKTVGRNEILASEIPEIIKSYKKNKFSYSFLFDKKRYIYFLYFSKNKDSIVKAKKYDLLINKPLNNETKTNYNKLNEFIENHKESQRRLGELLGYPKCCVEFYIKIVINKLLSEISKESKFVIESIKNSKKFSSLINNLSRNRLISHFPCSYECDKSKRYAKELLNSVENHNLINKDINTDIILFGSRKNKIVFPNRFNDEKINYNFENLIIRGLNSNMINALMKGNVTMIKNNNFYIMKYQDILFELPNNKKLDCKLISFRP
ncbi:MAG: DUF483 domain-containing protein [Nanoarchaeota archaeon]|nr:DUF483 domain-containing protein [Nanoarchaeota archaeon]